MSNVKPTQTSQTIQSSESILFDLIKFKSVTPEDCGVTDYVINFLKPLGFECDKIVIDDTTNLYAKLNNGGKNMCFLGHLDVVPVGDIAKWNTDPFVPQKIDGMIYGRGTCDMKGGVAAFMHAVADVLAQNKSSGTSAKNSISFLLTTDEEGTAVNGVPKVLPMLHSKNEVIDFCFSGEPTTQQICDTIIVGNRGSLKFFITVIGNQTHVNAPKTEKNNPISKLSHILSDICDIELDNGTAEFWPSKIEPVQIDANAGAGNIIPRTAKVTISVRFNVLQNYQKLIDLITGICKKYCKDEEFEIELERNGESFLSEDKTMQNMLKDSVVKEGITPSLSGNITSDMRFVKQYCNSTAELGLCTIKAHEVNECISSEDLNTVTNVYKNLLNKFLTQNF